MRAACGGSQLHLYNLHDDDSAAARWRRRLSPDGSGVYDAYLGAVGFSYPKAMAIVCENVAGVAIAIESPGESDLVGAPHIASGGIP